jgi:hypothetical protein
MAKKSKSSNYDRNERMNLIYSYLDIYNTAMDMGNRVLATEAITQAFEYVEAEKIAAPIT